MNEAMTQQKNTGNWNEPKLQAWIRRQQGAAVHELMERGLVASPVVEAKPAWVLPHTLLIGKIRDQSWVGEFYWFICGEAPLTHAPSSVAATPREAARHFALQWQLTAVRRGEAGNQLAEKAEALYQLVDEDVFWQG